MRPFAQLGYATYDALRKDLVAKCIGVLIRNGRYDTLVELLDTIKSVIAVSAISRGLLPMVISITYCVQSREMTYLPIALVMLLMLVFPSVPTFVYVLVFTVGLISIITNSPVILSMLMIGSFGIPLDNVLLQSVINYSVFPMLI